MAIWTGYPGRPEEDNAEGQRGNGGLDRTSRKTRTGQSELDSQERTECTGQLGMTAQPGQLRHDSPARTVRTRWREKYIARTAQLGQDSQERTAKREQPGKTAFCCEILITGELWQSFLH
jgi:hypothetical protein